MTFGHGGIACGGVAEADTKVRNRFCRTDTKQLNSTTVCITHNGYQLSTTIMLQLLRDRNSRSRERAKDNFQILY